MQQPLYSLTRYYIPLPYNTVPPPYDIIPLLSNIILPSILYYSHYIIIPPPSYITSHYVSMLRLFCPSLTGGIVSYLMTCHVCTVNILQFKYSVKVITRIVITHFPPQQATGDSKKYII